MTTTSSPLLTFALSPATSPLAPAAHRAAPGGRDRRSHASDGDHHRPLRCADAAGCRDLHRRDAERPVRAHGRREWRAEARDRRSGGRVLQDLAWGPRAPWLGRRP